MIQQAIDFLIIDPELLKRYKPTVVAVLLSGLIALVGVIIFGWDLLTTLMYFWSETLILGLFGVVKILLSKDSSTGFVIISRIFVKLLTVGLYVLLLSVYLFIFLMFIIALSGFEGDTARNSIPMTQFLAVLLNTLYALKFAIAGILILHGYSLFRNYFKEGENKVAAYRSLFLHLFRRVAIMDITIVFVGSLAFHIRSVLGNFSILWITLILIAIKTFLNVKAHILERDDFSNV